MGSVHEHFPVLTLQNLLTGEIGLSLVNVGADSKQATFTGFENNGAHLLLIDYVLVTKGVSVVDYKVLENGVPGRPASDHCPIVANLVIERSSS